MDQKDIRRRDVWDFDKFSKAYDEARKLVPLKQNEKGHPGAHDIKGEDLYVRNDANPYKAMGIPHNEELSDINPKYMNANQVDVFHGRKLTPEEKKKVNDIYGNQIVTHHQMAFILDESISDDIKMAKLDEAQAAYDKEELERSIMVKEEEEKEEEKTPEEEYAEKYNGKTVILNGDNAKISDDDGTAVIKSDSNELRMSWKQAHEVMANKGGMFKSKEKPEEKKEEPKEEKKEKKDDEKS